MPNEVSKVEEETIIGCVLIIEDYSAIVNELYLLRNGRESIIVFVVLDLIDQLIALLLLGALLLDQRCACIVDYL